MSNRVMSVLILVEKYLLEPNLALIQFSSIQKLSYLNAFVILGFSG